jgi:nucleotide-binding universal stress UspA family protein
VSGRIVVGVDGSENSIAALRWAATEAQLRAAILVIVTSWTFPYTDAGLGGGPVQFDPAALEQDAGKVLRDAIDAAGLDAAQLEMVQERAHEGRPADVLLEASRDADLLVVGSRGHGAIMGALVGSVSAKVMQHSTVPVVIVHPPKA